MLNATLTAPIKSALQITRFARTILYVTDFDRAYRFYTEILGLAPAYPAEGGWAEFTLCDMSLCIHGGRINTTSTANISSFSFSVADFDAAYSFLKSKGIVMSEPFKPCGDLRVSSFVDFDGNALSIEG
jgi:catechol 2,3-dioxygenase-like lactoylglutathione lyase family enzyme